MTTEEHKIATALVLPRLFTGKQARSYLGGANPASLIAPTYVGRSVRWDRFALDAYLDRASGLAVRNQAQTPKEAMDEWLSGGGPVARRS